MKLVILVVRRADLDRLLARLNARGFRATVIDAHGGFLRQGNATLILGVEVAMIGDLLRLIEDAARARAKALGSAMPLAQPSDFIPRAINGWTGGASAFVLNVERYERIA